MSAGRSIFLRASRAGRCLLWSGPVNKRGYGMASAVIDRCLVQGAHRIAWALAFGKTDFGVLRNTCGNRNCLNVDHWREPRAKESRIKVRASEIERLYREGLGIGEIAASVGCSRVTVWRHARRLDGDLQLHPGREGSD